MAKIGSAFKAGSSDAIGANPARIQATFGQTLAATAYDVILKGKEAPENEITINVIALDSDDEELINQSRSETFKAKEDDVNSSE